MHHIESRFHLKPACNNEHVRCAPDNYFLPVGQPCNTRHALPTLRTPVSTSMTLCSLLLNTHCPHHSPRCVSITGCFRQTAPAWQQVALQLRNGEYLQLSQDLSHEPFSNVRRLPCTSHGPCCRTTSLLRPASAEKRTMGSMTM